MPLAAPVTAAADPSIAVIATLHPDQRASRPALSFPMPGRVPAFLKLEPNHPANCALTPILFRWERPMGQSKPFRPTALIVEDDPMQREMICLLLEESDLDVVECASAEAAALVLEQAGAEVAMMMTDVNLA